MEETWYVLSRFKTLALRRPHKEVETLVFLPKGLVASDLRQNNGFLPYIAMRFCLMHDIQFNTLRNFHQSFTEGALSLFEGSCCRSLCAEQRKRFVLPERHVMSDVTERTSQGFSVS